MNDQDKQNLSAQVIMQPASGKRSIPAENITSENIHQLMPSAAELKKVQTYFSELGFKVDAGFANSFSITGGKKLFEKTFETKISTNEKQAFKARGANNAESSELPFGKLPQNIREVVETITFTEPPDFGPTNF